MNTPEENRESLLRAAKGGDDDALGQLIEEHRSLLRGIAERRMKGEMAVRSSPLDVVNTAWWAAFRSFPRFDGDARDFEAWLKTILDRTISNEFRTQKADKRNIDREEPPSGHLPQAQGKLTTPSEHAVRNERQQQLADAIALLSATQKEAIRLRYLQDYSVEELVEHFGRSKTAVAGLLNRGLKSLRRVLKAEE